MSDISIGPGRAKADRATARPRRTATRRRTAGAVVLTLTALLALSSGPTLANTLSCGATISTNTTLHSDLTNCPADGLVIGADNITLNLNGHTIDGDAVPNAALTDDGISNPGHHGDRILNGTVREFDHAVAFDAASHNRLHGITAIRNSDRAINVVNGSNANRIDGNTSADNGGSGLRLISSDYNLVENNTLTRNVVAGMGGFTAHHTLFRHNIVVDNGDNGIFWANAATDNRIEDNRISDNPGTGITIDSSDRNLVSGNHVSRSTKDISLSGDNNIIIANLLTDAIACPPDGCGDGITVEGGTANLVVSNSIARADQNGIALNAFNAVGGPSSIGTVIRNNLIHAAAADGIAIGTFGGDAIGGIVKDTRLDGNLAIGSGHDGINVASVSTTLTRNLAIGNANLGIEAVFGVTDGGGNRAFRNGNPLQCVNVDC
jgi:parallel beta-helix repeat protein